MTEDEIGQLEELVKAPQTVIGYHGCTVEAAETIFYTGEFKLSEEE